MNNKKKIVFLLAILWVTVGIAIVGFVQFINDKPKIAQENAQSQMSLSSYTNEVSNFLNNSAKIMSNSPVQPKLLP